MVDQNDLRIKMGSNIKYGGMCRPECVRMRYKCAEKCCKMREGSVGGWRGAAVCALGGSQCWEDLVSVSRGTPGTAGGHSSTLPPPPPNYT